MSGSDMSSDTWRFTTNGDRTLLLVGRTGDGKSATGNSILGRNAFTSMHSSSGVTNTCNLQSTRLEDGRILNVIDTPGLFNISREPDEFVMDELVKCMDLTKDGIHAVLVVLSIRMRFSIEELAAIQTFQALFGNKICDYMIVVFTGGDELEENDSLDDYLGHCPEPLKETLNMCGNRRVLFDNKTKDPSKMADQLRELLSIVSSVVKKNRGPYTKDLLIESKLKSKRMGSPECKSSSKEAPKKQDGRAARCTKHPAIAGSREGRSPEIPKKSIFDKKCLIL